MQYVACNHPYLDSHFKSTNIIITTLKSFSGRQVLHKSHRHSLNPLRCPLCRFFQPQKWLCMNWDTCLNVHWGDRQQWQTNVLQAYQQLFLTHPEQGGFLSSQWSTGVLGESHTISLSVSIVVDAGRCLCRAVAVGLSVWRRWRVLLLLNGIIAV